MSASAGFRFILQQMHSCENHSGVQMPHCGATAFKETPLAEDHQDMRRHSFDGNDAARLLAPRGRDNYSPACRPTERKQRAAFSFPHPSFVAGQFQLVPQHVNNRSMGWTSTFFALPLTVNKLRTSRMSPVRIHAAPRVEEGASSPQTRPQSLK